MAWKIERGIAIPKKGHSPTRYPWPDMKVGDSVLIEGDGDRYQMRKVSAVAGDWARRQGKGWVFTTRTVDGGIRVWRLQ